MHWLRILPYLLEPVAVEEDNLYSADDLIGTVDVV